MRNILIGLPASIRIFVCGSTQGLFLTRSKILKNCKQILHFRFLNDKAYQIPRTMFHFENHLYSSLVLFYVRYVLKKRKGEKKEKSCKHIVRQLARNKTNLFQSFFIKKYIKSQPTQKFLFNVSLFEKHLFSPPVHFLCKITFWRKQRKWEKKKRGGDFKKKWNSEKKCVFVIQCRKCKNSYILVNEWCLWNQNS